MDAEQTGRVLQMLETQARQLEILNDNIKDLEKKLDDALKDLDKELDKKFVSQKEFTPVSRIVFATVALILISFFGVLTALVYGGKHP